MSRYYRRRSPFMWVLLFLVAVVIVVFIAHVVYAWLLPLIPLIGAVLLITAFWWVGFRHH